tara:strand:- start:879 stop:1076 length:198 start_codon:yes stop_codon:yes gene_type:complete
MNTILFFAGIIAILLLMAKYTLSESERIKRNKKFMKNMEEYSQSDEALLKRHSTKLSSESIKEQK